MRRTRRIYREQSSGMLMPILSIVDPNPLKVAEWTGHRSSRDCIESVVAGHAHITEPGTYFVRSEWYYPGGDSAPSYALFRYEVTAPTTLRVA